MTFKITASADLYVYYDEDLKKYDFESSNENSICEYYELDHQNEFDILLSSEKENILEQCIRIINEKNETEINVYYYVEFEVSYFVQCTMDGTEEDSEYEILTDDVQYLGKAEKEEEKPEPEQTKDTGTFDVNINPISW